MTGDEALRILNQVTEICNYLLNDDEKRAFYQLGMLTEELAMKVRISECALNKREEELDKRYYETLAKKKRI
jgi:hypothetical protein